MVKCIYMPLTHEQWREPGAEWENGPLFGAVVNGPLDPIEIRDGRVHVRHAAEGLYGHAEAPYFPDKQIRKQNEEMERIEFEQLMVDRLQEKKQELLARMNVLVVDPSYAAHGMIEKAKKTAREAAFVCEQLEQMISERAISQSALRTFFSRRFGSLYEYNVMLRNSRARRDAACKMLDETQQQIAQAQQLEQEMAHIKKELGYIDHDLPMHEQRLKEYIAAAHAAGRVRLVNTGAPATLPREVKKAAPSQRPLRRQRFRGYRVEPRKMY